MQLDGNPSFVIQPLPGPRRPNQNRQNAAPAAPRENDREAKGGKGGKPKKPRQPKSERVQAQKEEEEEGKEMTPEQVEIWRTSFGTVDASTDLNALFGAPTVTPAVTASATPSAPTAKPTTPAKPEVAKVAATPRPAGAAAAIAARTQLFLERNAGEYSRYSKVYKDRLTGAESTLSAFGPVRFAELHINKHPEAGLGQRKNAMNTVQHLLAKVPAKGAAAAAAS